MFSIRIVTKLLISIPNFLCITRQPLYIKVVWLCFLEETGILGWSEVGTEGQDIKPREPEE